MNKCWRLVDLPGYGFAHGARKDRARFNQTVNDYLENRPNLSLVFALIESGLAPQAIDLEFVEWLVRHAVPFVFVFTKTDKVSAVTAQTNIAAFADRISAWFEKPPAVFTCSAATRQGRQELLGVIGEEMTAINTASHSGTVTCRKLTKPKPASARSGKPKAASRPQPPLVREWLSSSTMLDYDEFSRCLLNRLPVDRARLTRCLATSFLASAGPKRGNGSAAWSRSRTLAMDSAGKTSS